MNKIVRNLLVLSATILLCGCNGTEGSSSVEEISSSVDLHPAPDFNEIEYDDDLLWMPDLEIEVDQVQYMKNYLLEFEDSYIWVGDNTKLKFEDDYLTALSEGETFIVYGGNGKYKKVNVKIAAKGTYSRAYTFNSIADELKGKMCCNFGDSLSSDNTVGDMYSEYPRRFASKFKMHEMGEKWQEYYFLESEYNKDAATKREYVADDYDNPETYSTNYAMGGSTSIWPAGTKACKSEYGSSTTGFYNFYDGCSRTQILYKNGTLANMDVMFISYGYNDLYFQPEIDVEGDDAYCIDDTFATCNSFKGSWRYMINVARAANPNIRIILMNMIYNEYDYAHHAYPSGYRFNKGITYQDFRQAVYELGYEMDVKVIDPWNFMEDYYDYTEGRTQGEVDPDHPSTKYYYRDNMHPSKMGNKVLANFLANW